MAIGKLSENVTKFRAVLKCELGPDLYKTLDIYVGRRKSDFRVKITDRFNRDVLERVKSKVFELHGVRVRYEEGSSGPRNAVWTAFYVPFKT